MNPPVTDSAGMGLRSRFQAGHHDGPPCFYIRHSISSRPEEGQVLGAYVITLKDGRQFKTPVVFGSNIGGTEGAEDMSRIAREALPVRIGRRMEYLLPIALPEGSEVMSFVYRPVPGCENAKPVFTVLGTFRRLPSPDIIRR